MGALVFNGCVWLKPVWVGGLTGTKYFYERAVTAAVQAVVWVGQVGDWVWGPSGISGVWLPTPWRPSRRWQSRVARQLAGTSSCVLAQWQPVAAYWTSSASPAPRTSHSVRPPWRSSCVRPGHDADTERVLQRTWWLTDVIRTARRPRPRPVYAYCSPHGTNIKTRRRLVASEIDIRPK